MVEDLNYVLERCLSEQNKPEQGNTVGMVETVVVVEALNDIPLPFRSELSSAQGPPPQPP